MHQITTLIFYFFTLHIMNKTDGALVVVTPYSDPERNLTHLYIFANHKFTDRNFHLGKMCGFGQFLILSPV